MTLLNVPASWTDKDSKVERFRSLYEAHDFLEAYSQHTDLRIRDNPHGGIGRADEWETHGKLQTDFLFSWGLFAAARLLDIGCGTGRLARQMVPRLEPKNYTGVDISREAIAYARDLAHKEGWERREPQFVRMDGTLDCLRDGLPFDMAWAHSVFTHLPPEAIERVVDGVRQVLKPGGLFLFTYKRGEMPERTGLKQWRYPASFFEAMATAYGMRFEALPTVWPASQRTGVMRR